MKRLKLALWCCGALTFLGSAARGNEAQLAEQLRQRLMAATREGQADERQFVESFLPLITGAPFNPARFHEAHARMQQTLDGYLAILEEMARLSTPEAKVLATTALDAVVWQKELYAQLHGELEDLVEITRLADAVSRDEAELLVLVACDRMEEALPRHGTAIAKAFRAYAQRYGLR